MHHGLWRWFSVEVCSLYNYEFYDPSTHITNQESCTCFKLLQWAQSRESLELADILPCQECSSLMFRERLCLKGTGQKEIEEDTHNFHLALYPTAQTQKICAYTMLTHTPSLTHKRKQRKAHFKKLTCTFHMKCNFLTCNF